MKKRINSSAVIVAVIMVGFAFCKDIYKIGIKDGKATAVHQKAAAGHQNAKADVQKANAAHLQTASAAQPATQ